MYRLALLFLLLFAACSPKTNNDEPISLQQIKLPPLIVLDAGHGAQDKGTNVGSFEEKKIALETTYMVKEQLERRGYRVLMTRSCDIFLPLSVRTAIANMRGASLFVSVHYNGHENPQAHGVEVYYYNDKKVQARTHASRALAGSVLHEVLEQTGAKSRGVREGNFHVIRETRIPAILVEGGFVTNSKERDKLKDKRYLSRIADGIATGVDRYFRSC